jgi:Ca-activated chloride channel family protein
MANQFRAMLAAALVAAAMALTGCSAADRGTAHDSAPLPGHHDRTPRPDAGVETDTEEDPQSTFALDVDTASYGYAQRLIDDGHRPDRAQVRPEEFINSFDLRYPEPSGDGFAVHADGARLPEFHRPDDGYDVRLLRVGLQTRSEDAETRADAALTFVVDVSGSMAEPGRLDLVRDALHTLVDQLRATDAVAVVAFNERARVVREMTRVADADELHDAVDDLSAGGSTDLESGLELGYRVARDGFRRGHTNRVIILSDGLANVGNTEADPILRRVRDEAAKQIALLGVGVGSEYGDALMERLADRGDGFVVYVSERAQAREVFVRQLPATLSVRALDAKVQVEFEPSTVRAYRLIGYENRALADEDFRDDRVDGGEVGPGHSVTALYVVRLADEAPSSARAARVHVRWQDPQSRDAAEAYESVSVADLGGGFDAATPALRLCYTAAFFGETLAGGRYAEEVRLGDLAGVAHRVYEETDDRDVRDLAETIERARELD